MRTARGMDRSDGTGPRQDGGGSMAPRTDDPMAPTASTDQMAPRANERGHAALEAGLANLSLEDIQRRSHSHPH